MRLLCVSDPAFWLLRSHCTDFITKFIELFLEIIWMEKGFHVMCIDKQSSMDYPVNLSHCVLRKIKTWISVSTVCF